MIRYSVASLFVFLFGLHAATLQNLTNECQKSNAQACHDLGYLYDQKGKLKKAARLYGRSCDLHYGIGCYHLAELYLTGSGVKQNDEMFLKLMKKSCTLGYRKGCSLSGKKEQDSTVHKDTLSTQTKGSKVSIREKNIGTLVITAKRTSKAKRIVHIHASVRNQFSQASGWLSFSFPDITASVPFESDNKGFDLVRAYPAGQKIYHREKKHAVQGSYLLIEAESKHWVYQKEKELSIDIRLPENRKDLLIYIRVVFKHGDTFRSLPRKGSRGQQGFENYKFRIPIGLKKRGMLQKNILPKLSPVAQETGNQTSQPLDRKEKLLLLDQLLNFSYFHREKQAFEKQLEETLFGGATYLTRIKSYRCRPKKGTQKHTCLLILSGQANRKSKTVQWEFHASFTAIKTPYALRISEMHTLDLTEEP